MSAEKKKTAATFSGQLGFVLAAAGSAVGVGNLWRFPYLAAKDGGGAFIVIYLVLVVSFGFTLLVSDLAIGRKTGKSAIHAYEAISKKWKFLGVLTFLVPAVIMTYYAVIGGWITKFMVDFIVGNGTAAADDGYFVSFITSPVSPVVYGLIFMVVTGFVIYNGVESGIERCSKLLMPVLILLVVGISIFSLTLSHTDADGTVRTGLQGLAVYLKPDFSHMTPGTFLRTLLDAMSQIFFSLSVSMGIMITYGSYVKKDVNLYKSVKQIEIFDTGVALLAGMMIIPAIFVFSGMDGMAKGPTLMFVAMPKVFAAMGPAGRYLGIAFFALAIFATLTSCVSVLESITANCMEIFHASRKKTTVVLTVIYSAATAAVALGYSVLYFELKLPSGDVGQLLDLMDYISNSLMMPVISMLSAILIGWVVGSKWVTDEVQRNGEKFGRKKLYNVMIRFVVPVVMLILTLEAVGLLGWLK